LPASLTRYTADDPTDDLLDKSTMLSS